MKKSEMDEMRNASKILAKTSR